MPIDRRAFNEYHQLPEVAKEIITLEEWAWLSDSEKANFLTNLVSPEPDSEDSAY